MALEKNFRGLTFNTLPCDVSFAENKKKKVYDENLRIDIVHPAIKDWQLFITRKKISDIEKNIKSNAIVLQQIKESENYTVYFIYFENSGDSLILKMKQITAKEKQAISQALKNDILQELMGNERKHYVSQLLFKLLKQGNFIDIAADTDSQNWQTGIKSELEKLFNGLSYRIHCSKEAPAQLSLTLSGARDVKNALGIIADGTKLSGTPEKLKNDFLNFAKKHIAALDKKIVVATKAPQHKLLTDIVELPSSIIPAHPNPVSKVFMKGNEDEIYYYKRNKSGSNISEQEPANAEVARISFCNAPKMYAVNDSEGKRAGALSTEIESYQTILDYIRSPENKNLSEQALQDKLIDAGLAEALTSSYFLLEDNDVHLHNIGVDKYGKIFRIDFNQANNQRNYKHYDSKKNHAFECSESIIKSFPNLSSQKQFQKPYNWITELDTKKLFEMTDQEFKLFQNLQTNAKFKAAQYKQHLKDILIDEAMLWRAAELHFGSIKAQKKFVGSFKERIEKNKKSLLGMREFKEFLKTNSTIIDKIVSEFETYNAQLDIKSALIDIARVKRNFEKLQPRSFFQKLSGWLSFSYWFPTLFKQNDNPANINQAVPVENSYNKITNTLPALSPEEIKIKNDLLKDYFTLSEEVEMLIFDHNKLPNKNLQKLSEMKALVEKIIKSAEEAGNNNDKSSYEGLKLKTEKLRTELAPNISTATSIEPNRVPELGSSLSSTTLSA